MKRFLFGFVLGLAFLWLSNAEAQVVTGPLYCNNSATVTGITTITQVVPAPGTGSARTYICSYTISAAAASGAITFQYGTGTNCATGTTTFGPNLNLGATTTFTEGADTWHGFVAPSGQAVCVTAATSAVAVTIYYVQF